MQAPSSSDATSQSSFRSESHSHRSTASSYSDLGEIARAGAAACPLVTMSITVADCSMLRCTDVSICLLCRESKLGTLTAGSAPDGLGGFTFGSGSVRRASDGRCHFTITTGNTQPGPDAMPLAQEASCTHAAWPHMQRLHVASSRAIVLQKMCALAYACMYIGILVMVGEPQEQTWSSAGNGRSGGQQQQGRQWWRSGRSGRRPLQQHAQHSWGGPAARTDGATYGTNCSR